MTSARAVKNPCARDFATAVGAIRKLLANSHDTTQVFVIMRTLNGPAVPNRCLRMLKTATGRRQAYCRVELAERLSDRHGRRAEWLLAQDYDRLLRERLADARKRLRIGEPVHDAAAQRRLGSRLPSKSKSKSTESPGSASR